MKKKSLAGLKKELWQSFSELTRRSAANFQGLVSCYICSRSYFWKEMDASHFREKSICGLELFFYPKNVKVCCVRCNRYLHGNLAEYARKLQKEYGPQILEDLEAIRLETKNVVWDEIEYQKRIEETKVKLNELTKS